MQNKLFLDALSVRVVIPQTVESEYSFIKKFDEYCSPLGFETSAVMGGLTGYPLHHKIVNDQQMIIIRFGSNELGMTLHIEGKGSTTSIISQFLIDNGYKWIITRADIAIDFIGGFDGLHAICKKYAEDKNVKTRLQGDWEREIDGRTYYVGSPQSESMLRLYEKSEEQWAKGNKLYPENIVRLEWQFRPDKKKRQHIVSFDPLHLLSFSRNISHLFDSVCAIAVAQTVLPRSERSSDLESFYHMLHQYKNIINNLVSDRGLIRLIRDTKLILRA